MIESLTSVSTLSSSSPLSGTLTENSVSASSIMQPSAAANAAQPMSFSQILGDMATDTVTSLRASETKSFESIQGKANTREVVDAVMTAEQTLQTAIAIRDKVVTAYLEVARMQI
jgi:flagellar hook-basal body complex protein FliE